jgi:phosphatidylglycerol:prolipoprotein diacylglycerol transferase
VFAGYLILSGLARFLVEFLRTNSTAFLGMTQPQLWALVGIAAGILLATVAQGGRPNERVPGQDSVPAASAGRPDPERAGLAR